MKAGTVGDAGTSRSRLGRIVLPHLSDLFEELARINPEDFGDLQKLDHVYPALASFVLRDVALGASEPGGELDLGQASGFPCFNEELSKPRISLAED
jgi:hypothetical protein